MRPLNTASKLYIHRNASGKFSIDVYGHVFLGMEQINEKEVKFLVERLNGVLGRRGYLWGFGVLIFIFIALGIFELLRLSHFGIYKILLGLALQRVHRGYIQSLSVAKLSTVIQKENEGSEKLFKWSIAEDGQWIMLELKGFEARKGEARAESHR
eukprot:TRINITY_DN1405_c0_g1_i2.p1 TRINITY_DN1405_c0_g1~~TRINITY_DN1405_c0_g1_i2.p1  ORF type:complete len:155 (-),score=18.64 TRINITY_DN1405_c0_g1_i2:145-609(-)